MNNKSEYRKWAKELRQKLDLKKISAEIVDKIKSLSQYQSAKTVMSYVGKEVEISLSRLFEDKSKSWFLPVVFQKNESERGQIIVVPYIPSKTKLIKGKFNILEPEIIKNNFFNQIEKKIKLDLIFVPGLCFDKEGNRLGFGAGYYDKFLKLNPDSFKIGCCPKECLVGKLPIDPWDVKIDLVITD